MDTRSEKLTEIISYSFLTCRYEEVIVEPGVGRVASALILYGDEPVRRFPKLLNKYGPSWVASAMWYEMPKIKQGRVKRAINYVL